MATGDITAGRIRASGWEPELDFDGLTTGVSYNCGSSGTATEADVLASAVKGVLTVTGPGYDASGTLGTVTRTIHVRDARNKAYPDQASKEASASGGTLTTVFVGSETVYDGETVTGAIAAGIATGSNANGSLAFTNDSTRSAPQALARWITCPMGTATGNTLTLWLAAWHGHAAAQRPVQAVTAVCSNGTSSANAIVTLEERAAGKWGYKLVFDISGFGHGDALSVDAIAFPRVGGSSSRRLSSSGTPGTADFYTAKFLYDKTGALTVYAYCDLSKTQPGTKSGTFTDGEKITQASSGAIGYVSAGRITPTSMVFLHYDGTVDDTHAWTGATSGATFTPSGAAVANGSSGGVASTTAATAAASPFAAISDAAAAIATAHGTSDIAGGVIRLKEGVHFLISGGATSQTTANGPVRIEADPAATAGTVRMMAGGYDPNTRVWPKAHFKGITFYFPAKVPGVTLAYVFSQVNASDLTGFENCTLDGAGAPTDLLIAATGGIFYTNCTFTDHDQGPGAFGNTNGFILGAVDCTVGGCTAFCFRNCFLTHGCTVTGDASAYSIWDNNNTSPTYVNSLHDFNAIRNHGGTCAVVASDSAWCFNDVSTTGTQPSYDTGSGGDLANVVWFHNSIASDDVTGGGGRVNIQNDWVTPNNVAFTDFSFRGNSVPWMTFKSDVFLGTHDGSAPAQAAAPTLTGTWPWDYQVGCFANNGEYSPDDFAPYLIGLGSTRATSAGYTDVASDTTLTSGSTLRNRIRAGLSPHPLINDDGTGSIGRYQYPEITALTAPTPTIDSVTQSSVTVSWPDATGGTSPYNYAVKAGSKDDGEILYDTFPASGYTTSPYTVPNLQSGRNYFAKIGVTDAAAAFAETDSPVQVSTPPTARLNADGTITLTFHPSGGTLSATAAVADLPFAVDGHAVADVTQDGNSLTVTPDAGFPASAGSALAYAAGGASELQDGEGDEYAAFSGTVQAAAAAGGGGANAGRPVWLLFRRRI